MNIRSVILSSAELAIERQEETRKKAHATEWRLVDVRHHQLIASVKVKLDDAEFDVWVLADLDTNTASAI